MTISTFQAAKTICELSGWTVTHLKLQKLLYLAHMVSLGRGKGLLINDDQFQAGMHGPVLPSLYKKLSFFGNNPISQIFSNIGPLDEETDESTLLKEIYNFFGNKEGWELVGMTHSAKGAWSKNYIPDRNIPISNDDILAEYKAINKNEPQH